MRESGGMDKDIETETELKIDMEMIESEGEDRKGMKERGDW